MVSLQTVQCIAGLLLLKVKYAVIFAFLIGLSDFVPIIGPGSVFLPWIIAEFIIGNFLMEIALLALYTSVITLRQMLQPKLLAANLGLYPLTTLMALYIGFKLLGVPGLVLGPLSVVAFKAVSKAKSSAGNKRLRVAFWGPSFPQSSPVPAFLKAPWSGTRLSGRSMHSLI